jgi:hypothetical protein
MALPIVEMSTKHNLWHLACEKTGHVRGEKSAMIAHLISNKACPYALKEAKNQVMIMRPSLVLVPVHHSGI